MATFSTHLLNSVDGTHATDVEFSVYQIDSKNEKKNLFDAITDSKGRQSIEIDLSKEDTLCEYEMVINLAGYFSKKNIVSEIVVRFRMEDPKKKYHLPIIVSPHGYSIWWSK